MQRNSPQLVFNPPAWRKTIWAITSVFESGRPEGDPAAFQNHDAGIVSYGRHQATLASGALYHVLATYFRVSHTATSQALRQEYAGRVRARDAALRHDDRFKALLLQAAEEPAMHAAQDELFDSRYYQPAVARARSARIQTPLGLAVIYDTGVQGGVDIVLENVTRELGGRIGDIGTDGRPISEKGWIGCFLEERELWLHRLAGQREAKGDSRNAQLLRTSTFRVHELRTLLEAGNLLLSGRFTVRSYTINGIDHETTTDSSPPVDPAPVPEVVRVRNKIGFHTGPGGNRSGLNTADWGGWMTRLTEAGIPFFLKSVDDYGPIAEAVNHMQTSNVPHTLVYRLSTAGQDDGFSYDVPLYDASPTIAAVRHWQRTLAKLPPEFDRERVWIEPINEVDRRRADWLGRFATNIAELALRDGYKATLFGWSSGEPEPEDWEQPGMLNYLRLCAEHPERVAVSVHEYSYNKADIQDGFPHKIGRFQTLFAVCDRHGIRRPTVHITEWGWEYQNVPEPESALADIRWANSLYGPHPEVKGAAIWYLGRGEQFGDIANQSQRLIEPLTRLTVETEFEVAVPNVAPPSPTLRPASDSRTVADINFPQNSQIVAGSAFIKRWRIQNCGSTTWGPDFQLVHIPGHRRLSRRMSERNRYELGEVAARPVVAPGDAVEIALPMVAPATSGEEAYFSQWQLHDDTGQLFGEMLVVKIICTRPVAPATTPAGTRVRGWLTRRKRNSRR